jgi:hypothetical protein
MGEFEAQGFSEVALLGISWNGLWWVWPWASVMGIYSGDGYMYFRRGKCWGVTRKTTETLPMRSIAKTETSKGIEMDSRGIP